MVVGWLVTPPPHQLGRGFRSARKRLARQPTIKSRLIGLPATPQPECAVRVDATRMLIDTQPFPLTGGGGARCPSNQTSSIQTHIDEQRDPKKVFFFKKKRQLQSGKVEKEE